MQNWKKLLFKLQQKKLDYLKIKNNEVYTNKKIKEARKLKIKAKKEHEMAIRMKNIEQIKNKLDQNIKASNK